MTTLDGSGEEFSLATMVDVITPIANIIEVKRIKYIGVIKLITPNHTHNAARLPQVPGAIGSVPTLQHVAIQSDNCSLFTEIVQDVN